MLVATEIALAGLHRLRQAVHALLSRPALVAQEAATPAAAAGPWAGHDQGRRGREGHALLLHERSVVVQLQKARQEGASKVQSRRVA